MILLVDSRSSLEAAEHHQSGSRSPLFDEGRTIVKALRLRLGVDAGPDAERDSGFSLVEVMVAMVIFAIISTGVLYSMLSVMQVTRDSRARQVATNLAAQEIDLARDTGDLFALLPFGDGEADPAKVIELNGDTFTVSRSTNWISSPDADLQCGSGGGALRYKRVNVSVEWDGMRTGSDPVRADTVIDPKNRINDPSLGTILVSVLNAAGTGAIGIDVTAAPGSPANGAMALSATPADTDAQGCSYILRVTPGNYNVSVSKAGSYVDNFQANVATKSTSVAAGTASTVQFNYDLAATYTVTYAPSGVFIPNNLDTTVISPTYDQNTLTASTNALVKTHNLFPWPSGYQFIAGEYLPATTETSLGCVAPDPESWPTSADGRTGLRAPFVGVASGESGAAAAPMARAQITGSFGSNRYLKAVSQDSDPTGIGSPGCQTPMTYTFGQVLTSSSGTTTIALPYGSWKLYYGNSSTQNTQITSGVTAVEINPLGGVLGTFSGNTLGLDPRSVAP